MQQVGKHEPEKTDNTHALANTSTAMNERANELSLHIVYVWQAHVLKCEHAYGLVQTTRQLICRARVCVCACVFIGKRGNQPSANTKRRRTVPNSRGPVAGSRPTCGIRLAGEVLRERAEFPTSGSTLRARLCCRSTG